MNYFLNKIYARLLLVVVFHKLVEYSVGNI